MHFSCNITLASWAFDDTMLDLDFDGPEDFELTTYVESNEWRLEKTSAWRKTEQFPNVHFGMWEFTQLVYSITIRRRVGFYVYVLIIPSVLLSFLMPLTFWIPTTGDGRITLGRPVALSILFVCLLF